MNEERKLKRGLKDISPLFGMETPPTPAFAEADDKTIEVVSVFSPDNAGDSLFLNTYLASKLAIEHRNCTILSIRSRYAGLMEGAAQKKSPNQTHGPHFRHLTVTWDQFEEINATPVSILPQIPASSQVIFLDFEYNHTPHPEKLIPILDKWILLVQPKIESLSEAYKMIKATRTLHAGLDYYLIFDGEIEHRKASFLFERFSEIAAKYLGIGLVWLGCLYPTRESQPFSAPVVLEHLFMRGGETNPSPQKFAIAQWIQNLSSAQVKYVD